MTTRAADTKTTGYFQGDAIHHTGRTETLYGGLFYEVVFVEGHRKGETVLVVVPPSVGT